MKMADFLNELGLEARITDRVNHLAKSGAVDMEGADGVTYKALLYAAMLDVAEDIKPLSSEGRDMVKNLRKF